MDQSLLTVIGVGLKRSIEGSDPKLAGNPGLIEVADDLCLSDPIDDRGVLQILGEVFRGFLIRLNQPCIPISYYHRSFDNIDISALHLLNLTRVRLSHKRVTKSLTI